MKKEKKVYPLLLIKEGDVEVFAQNSAQEELGKACIEYVRLSNFIDKKFTEIPWLNFPVEPFKRIDKHFHYLVVLELDLEQLAFTLSKL